MNYIIVSQNKKLFIRIGNNGMPETCEHPQYFESSKARNIAEHLPKRLKRMKFKVEPVPDIMPKENHEVVEIIKKAIIQTDNYELSENISRWIDKFGACYDILSEAEQTLNVLISELKKSDNELLDILHRIELEPNKDLYGGWKIYKKIRENRRNRRIIKDETLIIENVLEKINPECLKREQIKKSIDGLFGRKYTFRIVEEDGKNVM